MRHILAAAAVVCAFFALRAGYLASPSQELIVCLWLAGVVCCLGLIRAMKARHMPAFPAHVMLAGTLSNALVMLANDGEMPVHGLTVASGGWRPVESGDVFTFLADRMAWGGASPGDFVFLAGLAGVVYVVVRGLVRG